VREVGGCKRVLCSRKNTIAFLVQGQSLVSFVEMKGERKAKWICLLFSNQSFERNIGVYLLADLMMVVNVSTFSEAPPTRNPSIFGFAIRPSQFFGFTEPP